MHITVYHFVRIQCYGESALGGFLDQVCPDAAELSSSGHNSTLIAVLGGGCVTDSELILDAIGSRQRKIPFVRGNALNYVLAIEGIL